MPAGQVVSEEEQRPRARGGKLEDSVVPVPGPAAAGSPGGSAAQFLVAAGLGRDSQTEGCFVVVAAVSGRLVRVEEGSASAGR